MSKKIVSGKGIIPSITNGRPSHTNGNSSKYVSDMYSFLTELRPAEAPEMVMVVKGKIVTPKVGVKMLLKMFAQRRILQWKKELKKNRRK